MQPQQHTDRPRPLDERGQAHAHAASRSVDALIETLRRCTCWGAHEGLVAAYAFGSRCEGRDRPDSDLDVGVVLDPAAQDASDLALAKLEAGIQRSAGEIAVDVVVLNEQGLAFQFNALSRGRVLYERSREARAAYEANLLSRYFDFLPTLQLFERYHTKGIRRRLALP